jgi:hypothetical protein
LRSSHRHLDWDDRDSTVFTDDRLRLAGVRDDVQLPGYLLREVIATDEKLGWQWRSKQLGQFAHIQLILAPREGSISNRLDPRGAAGPVPRHDVLDGATIACKSEKQHRYGGH